MPAEIVDLNERRRGKPSRLARELMRLPARRRLEMIMERPDAESVVAALDANDFFHSVVEIGPDDSLPMLALASTEQINHLFDIEWWRKDDLQPSKALSWLDRLSRASDHKLLKWLYKVDYELLVSLFKQWITLDMAPEDIDMTEAREQLPSRTLDQLYFWDVKYPQYDDLINHLLTLIFETNYGYFKELLNSVVYLPALEAEEMAYHFHRARLADHAIPDFYEALEIYRAIAPNQFTVKELSGVKEEDALPAFALALVPEGDLLGRVLQQIKDPEMVETLQLELASLSNKVVVADQLSPDTAEDLRLGVEKALAYVNLGLELRSGGVLENAAKIIEQTFLEHLFRLSQAEVAAIRGRLQPVTKSGWLGQCPSGIKCLDLEWFDAAEGILGKTPKLPRQTTGEGMSGERAELDFFRTPGDLARGNRIVDVIISAGSLYESLQTDPLGLERKLWPDGQVSDRGDITLGVMVLTAAAQFLAGGEWAAAPLLVKDWPHLFPLLRPPEMERAVMDWVHGIIPDPELGSFGAYLSPILEDYNSEMRPFSNESPPDPQLVKFFMFLRGSEQ
ncbi:MAG: DUF6178 family protein [Syntrophobacteraceae bacterium]